MQLETRWLERVMSISAGIPYHSYLDAGEESASEGKPLEIVGTTLFQLDNGVLRFQFFAEETGLNIDLVKAFARGLMTLRVPDQDFVHPVRITGESQYPARLSGFVTSECFGPNDTPLSGITAWFVGLPEGWLGIDRCGHYEAISAEQVEIQQDGTVVIPKGSISVDMLSGFTLVADGWIVRLREIPATHRTDLAIAHLCHVTNQNGLLAATPSQEFLELNLFPFLSFVFGQKVRFKFIAGYQDGMEVWARTSRQSETPVKTLQANWFLQTLRAPVDLSPLFRRFYSLPPGIKKHWRKIIEQYTSSEEVMGTLRDSSLAASISFAALDGLIRSMISTYSCKNEWLKVDLSLKRGKSIRKAIELVANQELRRGSKTFQKAAKEISKIRNATFHTDLGSDEDPRNAYYRWQASQALVEILLLVNMGLTEIPNRTAFGKFEVLGKDIFEEVRKEELTFE